MNNFVKLFYGILFEPVKTFRDASCEKPYKLPLVIVLLSSLFLLLLSESSFSVSTIFVFISKSINLLIYWIFFTFFVDLMSKIFKNESRYSELLTLTAYSFVPWIFLAPLKLLKNATFPVCSDIAIILLLGIWVWTFVLLILAVSETYGINRKSAIAVILIPLLGFILYFTWIVDFFVKLFQIAGL